MYLYLVIVVNRHSGRDFRFSLLVHPITSPFLIYYHKSIFSRPKNSHIYYLTLGILPNPF